MKTLEEIGKRAKEIESKIRNLTMTEKNHALDSVAQALIDQKDFLIAENAKDIKRAKDQGMAEGMQDRLLLTEERIAGMAEGLRQLTALEDPVGEVLSMKKRPNGLLIGQKRVPLGIIGIIYESRPNVTADAFGLCFKTNNVVILKGGKEAVDSNKAIVSCIRSALKEINVPEDAVQLIEMTDRSATIEMMKMKDYIDVLIPRGGSGLIKSVVENSTIPVIETGTGNCHIYVDESADQKMALDIIFNAKTQRNSVCNACESLVIHRSVLAEFLPKLKARLDEKQVELRGDDEVLAILSDITPATEEDWGTEYLDDILSIKTVGNIAEAIAHINKYSTKHSESIITANYDNAQKFLDEVDSSAVYVNASTRFTDGFEFGFGAEIGISNQKLHARGPMGLQALTTTKYIIYGNGQIRS